ncbi:hypothetical protein [Xylella fastidiosa]|uniref:hypothetical protein n=1 Tax=Xylella fastidiosa TaxID=2371 RepID=UPI00049A3E87|nr:hypothetical protein [Xylella fastidiosa]AIC13913.1 hypothetical protein P303_08000 [Xylella fastidiosa MUL0034]
MFSNERTDHKIASAVAAAMVKSAPPVSAAVLTGDTLIEWMTCTYILLQVVYLLWKWRVDWKRRKVKQQPGADHA